MPRSSLNPSSGLMGLAIPGRFGKKGGEPGVAIAERTGLGLATVAARKGEAEALKRAVASAYGVELPDGSRAVHGRSASFIGYGPGQWLAVSETFAGETLARELGERLRGLASISDQSGGRTVLRISGPSARAVLAKGLPIDLHPRAFQPGNAATSTISLMGVQIWQVDDAPSYDLAIFRSVSASFWRWLTASAGEFGYAVTNNAGNAR
ncbi:MAG TPA: sarcosine oxidase subunit gamma family protein [Methyloceanibacter sp.]|nr:sarcosine oxidase subunit gamma family protein [Methyloceanibacter sp.]